MDELPFRGYEIAKLFVDRFRGAVVGDSVCDEALMTGWFANAVMRGYDEHARRTPNSEETNHA